MAGPAESIDVSVATPLGLALSAQAESVSAPSVDGELTVLPNHVPLLAALKAGLLRMKTGHKDELAAVGPGFLEVGPARVLVLTEQLVRPADVDVAAARSDLEHANRELAAYGERHEGVDYEERQRAIDWAQARIDLVAEAAK